MGLLARIAAGIVVGSSLIVALAAGPPAAATDPAPPTAEGSQSGIEISVAAADGEFTITATGLPLPSARSMRRICVRLTSADGDASLICTAGRGWVRVRRSGEPRQLIPATSTRSGPGARSVVLRQADLMLGTGQMQVQATCPQGCATATTAIEVPRLVIKSCRATGPWLVHSAQLDIGKAVALTFDDGPGAQTDAVLRILRRNHVPATFFEVGRMIRQDRRVLHRIIRQGHVIGNHSFSHPTLVTDPRQVSRTSKMVSRVSGFRTCVFRAPYGANPPSVVALAKSQRLVTVNWNVDPGDWRGLNASQMVQTSLAQSRPGSILVFHDGEDHRQMVAGLPRLIHSLRSRGYRFLTMPELLRLPIRYRDFSAPMAEPSATS